MGVTNLPYTISSMFYEVCPLQGFCVPRDGFTSPCRIHSRPKPFSLRVWCCSPWPSCACTTHMCAQSHPGKRGPRPTISTVELTFCGSRTFHRFQVLSPSALAPSLRLLLLHRALPSWPQLTLLSAHPPQLLPFSLLTAEARRMDLHCCVPSTSLTFSSVAGIWPWSHHNRGHRGTLAPKPLTPLPCPDMAPGL